MFIFARRKRGESETAEGSRVVVGGELERNLDILFSFLSPVTFSSSFFLKPIMSASRSFGA